MVLHGDAAFAELDDVQPATDDDWEREYLSLDMAARVVDDIDDAIAHIRRWSSGHTEAIVTCDLDAARHFVARVDSAAVMVNASTRFTDGGEFGFGAEIGISTQKMHARGPMGLAERTKWVVTGDGLRATCSRPAASRRPSSRSSRPRRTPGHPQPWTSSAPGSASVESPRWHEGRLWFSDWIAGEIIAVDDTGARELIVAHQSLPLCFDFLPDGRAVLVSNQARALLTLEPGGELAHYADLSGLGEFGCNDIVVDGRGNAYVNSGNFEFAAGPPDGPVQPGFVALVTPDGAARVVAEDIAFPNGMAVTADNRTLVVADSYRHQLVGFAIESDGTLSGRHVWADLGDAAPDGICLDDDGAAWYADVPHQRCVRVEQGGEELDVVELDRGGFACMLGGVGPAQPLRRRRAVAGDGRTGRRRALARPGAALPGRRAGRGLAGDRLIRPVRAAARRSPRRPGRTTRSRVRRP